MIAVDGRAVFGRKVRRVEDVLDADRQAVQRGICGSGRGRAAGALQVIGDKGADLALARRDRLAAKRDHGGGLDLAGFDPAGEVES
jgi:hypothetical protein